MNMILKQYQKAFVDTPAIVVNFRPISLKKYLTVNQQYYKNACEFTA